MNRVIWTFRKSIIVFSVWHRGSGVCWMFIKASRCLNDTGGQRGPCTNKGKDSKCKCKLDLSMHRPWLVNLGQSYRTYCLEEKKNRTWASAQVLPGCFVLGCLLVFTSDWRCARPRWREEVNGRLCAPAETGAWVVWSQISGLTGSVLREPPPGLGRARRVE